MEKGTGSEAKKNETWWKVYLIYTLMLVFAAAIVIRTLVIIFVEGEDLLKISHQQSLRYEQIQAVRGNIYSTDNVLLAASVPVFTARMDLHKSVVVADTFRKYLRPLCDSLHAMYPEMSSAAFRKILVQSRLKNKRNLLIKKDLTYAQLKRMKTFPLFKKGQFKGGFVVEEKEQRSRPNGVLAARTIGYYNMETQFGVGLERSYNTELAGISGKRLTQRVANGVWRPIYSHDEIEPENGRDIISTIHVRIQDVAQAALRRCMEENEAQHGCAILMEVSTGRITAIANLMKQADGTYDESMNYAIGESVEPGSTFKLASVIAILEDGRYDTSTMVPTGVMEFSNRKMVDSHRGGYGQISLKSAFEKSSNVGISYLVYESFHSDPQKFVDYLYKMGLNTKLGLEIAGEGAPYIKSTSSKTWSKISLPWMSIGYELRLTPLQILSLYNAVANDGKLMKPQFVKEIKQGDKVVREFQPVVLKDHICSRSTLNKVKGLLEGVVEKGTARSLSHSPYKVAGKTGTAQINYANRGVQKMSYRASFVGYFPADDPKYSCIVMITNPQKNRRYGGEVAAPVFKEIGDKVYATLLQNYKGKNVEIIGDSIQKTPLLAAGYGRDIQKIYRAFQLVDAQVEPTAFVRLSGRESAKEEREEFQTISLVKDQMPNVCGLGLRDAVFILEKYGLKVQIYGRGMVKKQSVPVGTPCVHGQTVILELA